MAVSMVQNPREQVQQQAERVRNAAAITASRSSASSPATSAPQNIANASASAAPAAAPPARMDRVTISAAAERLNQMSEAVKQEADPRVRAEQVEALKAAQRNAASKGDGPLTPSIRLDMRHFIDSVKQTSSKGQQQLQEMAENLKRTTPTAEDQLKKKAKEGYFNPVEFMAQGRKNFKTSDELPKGEKTDMERIIASRSPYHVETGAMAGVSRMKQFISKLAGSPGEKIQTPNYDRSGKADATAA